MYTKFHQKVGLFCLLGYITLLDKLSKMFKKIK